MVDKFTQHIPPPCNEEVKIVHADDDIVVVDKPSGLLSVPGRFVKDCVLRRLAFDFPDVAIVHRLDLDTSGLLVLALNKHAARDLSRQFRERTIEKEYLSVVWGNPGLDAGEIHFPLRADPDNRPRNVVDELHGKEASTFYQVLESRPASTVLLLRPKTGRSHQLRVHLAHIGHPILGCDLYAHPAAFEAADRLMLHASRLTFVHPGLDHRVSFSSHPDFLESDHVS